ncbi:MAG: hypothetical protein ACFFCS_17305 [Candidatus Hodarchaeota archaeon]
MIENLYIISETGICIYHHSVSGTVVYDENLVSAFLSALSQFSQETFQESTLEKLSISNKKKIMIYNPMIDKKLKKFAGSRYSLKVYAVVHYQDHEKLVLKTLKKIYLEFCKKFEGKLSGKKIHEVSAFESFDENMKKDFHKKIYARNRKSSFMGLLLSIGIIVASILLIGLLLRHNIDEGTLSTTLEFLTIQEGIAIFVIFTVGVNIILMLAGVIGGYVVGSRNKAFKNGIRLTLIIILAIGAVSFRQGYSFFLVSFLFLVYFSLNAILSNYIGGYLRDLHYFYPIERND